MAKLDSTLKRIKVINRKNKIKQAVILAGGKGERLRPITNTVPKPMALVNGIPFLDYLIGSLIEVGIKKILILVGYKSEVIISRYNNANIDISFSYSDEKAQTGKRIIDAYDKLDSNFLLLYGDNYWPIDLQSMMELYILTKAEVTTTVFRNKYGTGEYGLENNIEVLENFLVKRYDKSRKSNNLNGVDIGYFIINKNIFNELKSNNNLSFENDILPNVIKRNTLYAYLTDDQYYFITNIETLKNFEKYVINNKIKPYHN